MVGVGVELEERPDHDTSVIVDVNPRLGTCLFRDASKTAEEHLEVPLGKTCERQHVLHAVVEPKRVRAVDSSGMPIKKPSPSDETDGQKRAETRDPTFVRHKQSVVFVVQKRDRERRAGHFLDLGRTHGRLAKAGSGVFQRELAGRDAGEPGIRIVANGRAVARPGLGSFLRDAYNLVDPGKTPATRTNAGCGILAWLVTGR